MPVKVEVPPDVFRMPITVRYLEADQQGVVFNMWYLGYIDEALSAYLAHVGLTYADLIASGYDVMLVHTELDWAGSLRWQDRADVLVSPVGIGNTSLTLDYAVQRRTDSDEPGDVVLSARIVYVVVDATTHERIEVPEKIRAAIGDPRALRRVSSGRGSVG